MPPRGTKRPSSASKRGLQAKAARIAAPAAEQGEVSETLISSEEEEEDYEERDTITFTVARILKDQQEMNFNFELSTSLNGRMFGSLKAMMAGEAFFNDSDVQGGLNWHVSSMHSLSPSHLF